MDAMAAGNGVMNELDPREAVAGVDVVLFGLKVSENLNGQAATILPFWDIPPPTPEGRVPVLLRESGKPVAVKIENLRVVGSG